MTDEGQRTSTVPTAGVTPSRGTSAYALKVAPPAVATPPTTEPLGPEEKGPWTRGLLVRLLLRNALIMTLLLIAVGFGVINPHFATLGNASTLGIELSAMALLTFGEAGVLLTAGIDLSVGSIAGFSGVMAAEVLTHGGNFAEALVCAIVIGGAVGLVNGGLTAYAGIPAFIVTLGTMSAVLSAAYIISVGEPVMSTNLAFLALTTHNWLAVPIVVWITVVLFLVWWGVLARTSYGTHVYAVGGNQLAARLAGVRVKRVITSVYVVSGLLAGLAGVILASESTAGIATTGSGYELNAIAGGVIGGVSLFGGRGKMWGAAIGILMITMLTNGMSVLNVSEFCQGLATGALIVFAVFMDGLYLKVFGEK